MGLLKAAHNSKILDPSTGQVIMQCREEHLGRFTKLLRFSDFKRTTPFDIKVGTPDGRQVLRVKRGVPVMISKVKVLDENDYLIGGFKQKPFSLSGAFDVLDAEDNSVCMLKGGLTGWNFRFLSPGDVELACVSKKWAGIGKELLSSKDDYMLEIDEAVPTDSTIRQLILASVLCIGMTQKIDVP